MWEGFSSRFPISKYCRIVRFGSCLTHLFNLTSGRDASHMCLISLSSRHMCLLRHMWEAFLPDVGLNKSVRHQWAETKNPPTLKRHLLMQEGFSSRSPISRYCPLWLMPHGFVQSYIGERRLPHVPYKLVQQWYTCVLSSSL